MAAEKKISAEQKRKILLILRILLLTAAVLYLFFLFYNNYLLENKIKIYFATADAGKLKAENREINEESDLYYQVFEELKAGPKSSDLSATIPAGSKLLDYSLENNILSLNFNSELKNNHWGGSTGELMTIYSIVNSYTNFNEVEKVKILLEGKEVESLVGHLDLSQPLLYNQKLTDDGS